jgi:hypothetical protein
LPTLNEKFPPPGGINSATVTGLLQVCGVTIILVLLLTVVGLIRHNPEQPAPSSLLNFSTGCDIARMRFAKNGAASRHCASPGNLCFPFGEVSEILLKNFSTDCYNHMLTLGAVVWRSYPFRGGGGSYEVQRRSVRGR